MYSFDNFADYASSNSYYSEINFPQKNNNYLYKCISIGSPAFCLLKIILIIKYISMFSFGSDMKKDIP